MTAVCPGCTRPVAEVSAVRLDVTATIGSARTVARIAFCGQCGAEMLDVIGRYVGLSLGEMARLAQAELMGDLVTAGGE